MLGEKNKQQKHFTLPGFSQNVSSLTLSGKLIYVKYCVLPLFRFTPAASALFVPDCILFIVFFRSQIWPEETH